MALRRLAPAVSNNSVWLKHSETWPVIVCTGIGVAWVSFCSARYLLTSPDVQWSKTDRGSIVRENFQEGEKWTSHKKGLIDANIETIAMSRRPIRKYKE